MLRKLAAVATLVFLVACVSAKEYKGTVNKIDTDKKTLTVKVGEDEKTFTYNDSTEFVGPKGTIAHDKLGKFAERANNKGVPATVTTEEKDGKEVVKDGNPVLTKLTIGGGGRRPSPNKGQAQ